MRNRKEGGSGGSGSDDLEKIMREGASTSSQSAFKIKTHKQTDKQVQFDQWGVWNRAQKELRQIAIYEYDECVNVCMIGLFGRVSLGRHLICVNCSNGTCKMKLK